MKIELNNDQQYCLLLAIIVVIFLLGGAIIIAFAPIPKVFAGERLDINLEPIGNLIDGGPGVVDFGEIARDEKVDEIIDRLHYEVTTTPIYEDDLKHQELLDAIEDQLNINLGE